MSDAVLQGSRPDDLVTAAHVARRYYLDQQSKVEIAAAMNMSRFRVARLLSVARTSGLVNIKIETPGGVHSGGDPRVTRLMITLGR
jgi:DNA-binding transcriptional regulator LsrR (DeoR family)